MPWDNPEFPSMALGTLKSVLIQNDMQCDCWYFSNQFYSILEKHLNEPAKDIINRITSNAQAHVDDWLFSRSAFNIDKSDYIEKFIGPNLHLNTQALLQIRNEFEIVLKDIVNKFNWTTYDYIGLTCTLNQMVSSLAMSRFIKQKHPKVKTMLGGAVLSEENGQEILNSSTWIDWVFIGDGENTLIRAIKDDITKNHVKNIPGLLTRNDDTTFLSKKEYLTQEEFNNLPFPDHDDFFVSTKNTKCPMETSRGCPHSDKVTCSFCSMAPDAKFRVKKQITDEVLYLKNKYPQIKQFEFMDLNFPVHLRMHEFSKLKHLNLSFVCTTRSDALLPHNINNLKLIKNGGMDGIFMGIESVHPRLLRLMRKGHLAINCISFLKWAKYYCVLIWWNVLFGIPEELTSDYEETIDMLRKITHFDCPSAQPICITRDSPYFKNIKHIEPFSCYDYIYPSTYNRRKIAWEFKVTDTYSMLQKIHNTFYVNQILELISRWKRHSGSLTRNGLIVHDNRTVDSHKTFLVSNNEVDILEYCYIPQKKDKVENLFLEPDIHRLLELDILILLDDRYLNLIEPQNDLQFYSHENEEMDN